MGYRIRYGRQRISWNLWKIQTVLAVCLWLGIHLAASVYPGVWGLFRAQPDLAQKAGISSYEEGMGFRDSMLAYCAAVLEQAGYEKEDIR